MFVWFFVVVFSSLKIDKLYIQTINSQLKKQPYHGEISNACVRALNLVLRKEDPPN
jgi:hypothetical protein